MSSQLPVLPSGPGAAAFAPGPESCSESAATVNVGCIAAAADSRFFNSAPESGFCAGVLGLSLRPPVVAEPGVLETVPPEEQPTSNPVASSATAIGIVRRIRMPAIDCSFGYVASSETVP